MAFKERCENSFSDMFINSRLQNVNSFLKEIDSIIDFDKLRPILKKNKIGTRKNACGVKAYDSLVMFRVLLLQKYYNLSDKATEEALKVNLLFMKFVGLGLEDDVPDDTTICRFRNSLLKEKLYDKLFLKINKQLEDKGLIAKEGKNILIDASLIKSDNDKVKNKDETKKSEDRLKVEASNDAVDVEIEEELKKKKPSVKKLSRLLKKKEHNSKTLKNKELDEMQNLDTKDIETSKDIIDSNKDSYDQNNKIDKEIRTGYQAGKKEYATGYKVHVATDEESGAIVDKMTTFANTSDISTIETFVEQNEDMKSLNADKAYKSKEIDDLLKEKNIENNICHKETKNMSKEEKKKLRESEKPKHKIRAKVEHTFARIKTQMKYTTSRYIGLVRNNLNFTLVCIASNLKLMAHKQMKLQKIVIK